MNINANAISSMLEKQILTLKRDILLLQEHVEHEPPKIRAGYLLAHQLKGSAACMGFEELGAIAADVHERFEVAFEGHHEHLDDELRTQLGAMIAESETISVEKSTLYKRVVGAEPAEEAIAVGH